MGSCLSLWDDTLNDVSGSDALPEIHLSPRSRLALRASSAFRRLACPNSISSSYSDEGDSYALNSTHASIGGGSSDEEDAGTMSSIEMSPATSFSPETRVNESRPAAGIPTPLGSWWREHRRRWWFLDDEGPWWWKQFIYQLQIRDDRTHKHLDSCIATASQVVKWPLVRGQTLHGSSSQRMAHHKVDLEQQAQVSVNDHPINLSKLKQKCRSENQWSTSTNKGMADASYSTTPRHHVNAPTTTAVMGPDPQTGQFCPICLDAYQENDPIRLLRCNHLCHQECIDKWFRSGKNTATCPICRDNFCKSQGTRCSEQRYPELPWSWEHLAE